jgi:hypothetical protein
MPFLAPPSDQIRIAAYPKPSGSGQFLVKLADQPDGYCPIPEEALTMRLYWIEDFSLRTVGNYVLCENKTLNTIFSDPQTFTAWGLPMGSNCSVQLRSEVTYTWNETEAQFIQSTPLPCIMDDTPNDQNLFSCGLTGEGFCGFDLEDQEALEAIDAVLALPPEFADDDFLLTLRYWRGLRLKALDRPDEALAEYVGIYEDAPESAWGMLAALHFEAAD